MATRERPIDRGTRLGRAALDRVGREIREARRDRGLSVDTAAIAAGISNAQLSRVERALAPRVPLATLARCAAVVGLDLTVRLYPGASPVRDDAHAALLQDFRGRLHPSLRWDVEVPLPLAGDQRAWDALVRGPGWRYGTEAETSPRDGQALVRRLQLKQRDGGVDGVLLLVRDTQQTRALLRGAPEQLGPMFPVPPARAMALLAAGLDPGGSAVIIVPRTRRGPRPRRRDLVTSGV